ncbi:hypothetical protein NL676_021059 [Syzygium grande]|nr:hypothetical protein NL676_021059 [Syzygium grande]
MRTKLHRSSLLLLLFFFLVLFLRRSRAQPNTTGYDCPANQTGYPCRTYAFYRGSLATNYTDLASIGDLFGVSRLMIAKPSKISTSALSAPLVADQPLFVPLTCSCNPTANATNISYASITYTIRAGDTFYRVSTGPFENLTSYQSVDVVNPDRVATYLGIGVDVVFPIFCKCPNETQLEAGVNYLVSYVLQPGDNLSSVASRFGVQEQSIAGINGQNTKTTETLFVPVSKLPNLKQPIVSASAPSAKNERTGVIVGLAIGVGVLGAFLILWILLSVRRVRNWILLSVRTAGESRGSIQWHSLFHYSGGAKMESRSPAPDRLAKRASGAARSPPSPTKHRPPLLRRSKGSANIRVGLAQQDTPFTVPRCIARYTSQVPKQNVQDQTPGRVLQLYWKEGTLFTSFPMPEKWKPTIFCPRMLDRFDMSLHFISCCHFSDKVLGCLPWEIHFLLIICYSCLSRRPLSRRSRHDAADLLQVMAARSLNLLRNHPDPDYQGWLCYLQFPKR